MADGEAFNRNDPPRIHRLVTGDWGGVVVALARADRGLHAADPQDLDRMGFHVGAPVRADCWCEGRRLSGWQSPGDFDLIPAGARGAWEDSSPAEFVSVRFRPEALAQATEALDLPPERGRLAPRLRARDPLVQLLVLALRDELDCPAPGPALYRESLGQALARRLVAQHTGAVRPRISGLSPRQLDRVVELVEAELDRELSLADLAAAAGVSISHFTAMFRRAMGQSAHRYLVERRVMRAQALLARGRASVTEAAAAAGFAHPSHMARWMRRVSGLTPSAFARAA